MYFIKVLLNYLSPLFSFGFLLLDLSAPDISLPAMPRPLPLCSSLRRLLFPVSTHLHDFSL